MMRKEVILLCGLLGFVVAVGAAADGAHLRERHDRDHDHDRAREALGRGEAAPLHRILPAIEARLGARVIEVALEREGGRLVYEFALIAPDGRLLEAEIDARSGALITVEAEAEDD